jgi:hypothetical protein
MATTYEFEDAWRSVGVQIKAAMDTTWGLREAFLADHVRQAAGIGVGLLRSIPEEADVDLAGVVGDLGEQVLGHTRFLCGVAHLDAPQAECLMDASRRGFDRFRIAFRDAMVAARGQTREQILSTIEATLAVQPRIAPPPTMQAGPDLLSRDPVAHPP